MEEHNQDETKDEIVDGPKIAAEILNRMDPSNKEKIVKAIQTVSPEIATRIEDNLYNFDDIAELAPQGVQTLLKEVSERDVLLSLKTASTLVKDTLFSNMSERKRQIVQSDFEALPQVRLSEVQDAQRRILKKLDDLRTSGAIRTRTKHDVWV